MPVKEPRGLSAGEVMSFLDSLFGPGVPAVSVAELKAASDAGKVPILVDVRNPDEFASGHAVGAINLPLPDLAQLMPKLEAYKGQTVYVICRSGARSATACKAMIPAGYQAINVEGGTLAWIAAGYPIA